MKLWLICMACAALLALVLAGQVEIEAPPTVDERVQEVLP